MALVVKDRVRQFTTTSGTGTIALSGSIAGFQSFSSALSDGDTTYYAIVNSGGDYEIGLGTFSSSGETLSRDTILESSNAGSAVNFGAGSKEVFITYPAEKSVKLDADGYIESADGRNLSNVTAASYTVTSGDVTTALGYTPVQPGDNVSTLTNDSGYLTTVAFGDLTSTPTTLSGYGITDAATSSQGSLADSAVQPGDNISTLTNNSGYLTTVAFGDLTSTPTTLSGYGITDAATSSQGSLADSAVQPGDNISTLTNNAGYITSPDGGDADTVDGIQASSFVRGDGVNNGAVTIEADDSDFVVRDATDSPSNYIWRDHSDSKLYLGTSDAVATLRSTLDLNSNNITNGGTATLASLNVTGTTVFDSDNVRLRFVGSGSDHYIQVSDDGTSGSGTKIRFAKYLSTDTTMTVDVANERVGIKTTSPSTELDVDGTVTATAFSGDGSSVTNVDADTLDSLDSTQFLRSDTDDTFTGSLTVNGDVIIEDSVLKVGDFDDDNFAQIEQVIGTISGFTTEFNNAATFKNLQGTTNQLLLLGDTSSGSGDTLFGIGISSDGGSTFSKKLNFDGTGELFIGTSGASKVWHQGNDGSGSGLDADTVDGIQGSAIVTTTTITNYSLNPRFSSTIGFGNDSQVLRHNDGNSETRSDWWSSKDGFYIQGDGNNVDNVVLKSGYLNLSQNAFIEGKLGVDSGITEGVYNLTGTQLNPINGGIQYKILGGNTTFSEALTDGESLILRLDGGATYTVTWPTITWIGSGGNVAPTLNGTKDTFVFWQESGTFYGAYIGYGA